MHRNRREKRRRWNEILDRLPKERALEAVEVGVWRGQTSQRVLSERPLCTLHLVDLWLSGTTNKTWLATGSQMAALSQDEIERVYEGVKKLCERHPNGKILRMDSIVAAETFADRSVDLVFIDAEHSRRAVYRDITGWLPKVKPGAWIGGHDYESKRFPGVKEAVLSVFPLECVEKGANSTWWVRVP